MSAGSALSVGTIKEEHESRHTVTGHLDSHPSQRSRNEDGVKVFFFFCGITFCQEILQPHRRPRIEQACIETFMAAGSVAVLSLNGNLESRSRAPSGEFSSSSRHSSSSSTPHICKWRPAVISSVTARVSDAIDCLGLKSQS